MKILITGVCGFTGSKIAMELKNRLHCEIFGIDNLSRRGSETNISVLKEHGITFYHGDIRKQSDIYQLPKSDWVIDCAANPTVLAGINQTSSLNVAENNLWGTINILEYCKRNSSGLILISTSRVYSITELLNIKLKESSKRFYPDFRYKIAGFSKLGVSEKFSTSPPISFYGATKLSSEIMCLEYANAFGFPLWINRSSILAGPGQFGRVDQGIMSFWVYSAVLKRQLKYIEYKGKQVRDFLSLADLSKLIFRQIKNPNKKAPKVVNIGGGISNSMSLIEMTDICEDFLGRKINAKKSAEKRKFDIPYYVSDITLTEKYWNWKPTIKAEKILIDTLKWASVNKEQILKSYGL